MDYEKKYKEVLNKAKHALDCDRNGLVSTDKPLIFSIFPELKESEDEKNIKDLIDELKCSLRAANCQNDACVGGHEKRIALLEWAIAWLEKQGEQKPIDNIKPKFHEGEWVVNNTTLNLCHILKIEHGQYICDDCSFPITKENEYHPWTIQDAKDGDVLVDSYAIIIFRKIGNYVWDDVVDFYICYNFEKGIILQSDNLHCGSIDRVFFKPATKEKRDFLFQKMKEARYEWDAEKKELKKIEQNLAWNGADEAGFGNALWAIEQARSIAKDENDMGNLWYAERWLQSVKERMKGE